MTNKYQDQTEALNTGTPAQSKMADASPFVKQRQHQGGKRNTKRSDLKKNEQNPRKMTVGPTTSPPGRSRFRPTYPSGLNLSALKLSSLSRLWLHDSKNGPLRRVGHGVMLMSAIAAAGVTALDLSWVQFLERESQTFFFQRRGTVASPDNIVIVEMDEASLSAFRVARQGHQEDSDKSSPLKHIDQWPWKRFAYGIAIDHLFQAGATAVAVDVVIDQPSTRDTDGEGEDDLSLQRILQQYPGQVVLASTFTDEQQETGGFLGGIRPLPEFTDTGAVSGYINYPLESNGRIHRFSHTWLQQQIVGDAAVSRHLEKLPPAFHHSFVQRTVAIAQSSTAPSPTAQDTGDQGSAEEHDVTKHNTHQQRSQQIFFYGPTGQTFAYESFWELLDPQEWERHQRQQTFQDKIVLIGPTAQLFQDFHRTPFGQMPGVEIHANAIATFLEGRTINEALPHPYFRGAFVLVFALGIGYGIGLPRRLLHRTAITMGGVGTWALCSYLGWLFLGVTMPTAIPIGTILSIGMGYVVTGLVQGKLKLRGALKRYVSSPIVQDIINQQDDLQDLISENQKEAIGKKLDGRYEIVSLLGSGGFGQTFIAKDLHRPGSPECVVKQLRPITNDPQVFRLSKRLFEREADTLERLGNGHKQVPQLLAYFEEADQFYLVQELIGGRSLSTELRINHPYSDVMVIRLLQELLEILTYIHGCKVIHRDIKPSNVIRRASDKKLVLIDFGAVKEMQEAVSVEGNNSANQTVCIGTRGYMPNEQLAGSPRFNSDIYAVGIIGIQASTKRSPDAFDEDPKTGELLWQPYFNLGLDLKDILYKMTRYDFKQRYQSAQEALDDLEEALKAQPGYDPSDSTFGHPYAQGTLPQNWNPPSDLEANTETVQVSTFAAASMDSETAESLDQSTAFGNATLPWPTQMNDSVDKNEGTTNH